MRETGLAAQTAGGTREQQRAAPYGHEAPGCLASDQKTPEAADAPEFLEHLGRQFAQIQFAIVACVVSDEIERIYIGARCHGMIEQSYDVLFPGRIHGECFCAAAFGNDRTHHLLDFFEAASRDEHMVAALGKTPA